MMAVNVIEPERLEALQKWAGRVFQQVPVPPQSDRRRAPRRKYSAEVQLTPLDPNSNLPLERRSVTVITRDVSDSGMGVVTNVTLNFRNYFAKVLSNDEILLVAQVRCRPIQGSILEYGFEVVDRYANWEELHRAYGKSSA